MVARADARLLEDDIAPATIRFYFDYISSNAYLAWTQLPKLAEKYGCTVLGGLGRSVLDVAIFDDAIRDDREPSFAAAAGPSRSRVL